MTEGGRPQGPEGKSQPLRHALAVCVVLVASAAALPFRGYTDPDNLTMIYFTAVVFIALKLGLSPAILGSVLSVALFNFLFTPPYYSFEAINPASYLTFGIMLVSSLLAATLASGLSARLERADVIQGRTRLLLDIARALSRAASRAEAEQSLIRHLQPRYRGLVRLDATGEGAADGHDHSVLHADAGRWTLPLAAGGRFLGSLVIDNAGDGEPDAATRLELETIAALAAGTLLRIAEAEGAMRAQAAEENERLRNVLLASLSHDLRTPLTVLSGTAGNLLRLRRKLPREAIDEIAQLSRQITRLQKFTGNLLKMAAISSGQLKLNREPYAMQEIVGATLQRARETGEDRQWRTAVIGTIPLVPMDGALIEQVLSNLVDNAVAHTEPNGVITIRMERAGDSLKTSVIDDGPGLSPGDEAVVFERFRTGATLSDRKAAGSHGLGLAICRGIVEAHGGRMDARNNAGAAGACFSFTLPVETQPETA